jgi:hypothetical protein
LHRIANNGGAATKTSIEVIERAWPLWNYKYAGIADEGIAALAQPLLANLRSSWRPGQGIAMIDTFLVPDGDHTGIVTELLVHAGYAPDLEALFRYEEETHFRCYALENDVSLSANIHVLGALHQLGLSPDHRAVDKIVKLLYRERNAQNFWIDKWHSSPYYPTSLVVMVGAGYLNDLAEDAVKWIANSQNSDGSWGYFLPTAEETAYCLQALLTWHQKVEPVSRTLLARAAAWLSEHAAPPYTPLWISKCLYTPTLVVQSAVISALEQYRAEFGALP